MDSECGTHDGEEKCIKDFGKKKTKGNSPLGKTRHRRKDIKMYVKSVGCESIGLIWLGMRKNGALL